MYKLRRKLLSQNFLRDPKLVSKLVESSSIGKNDLVLEIGPGKGIITEKLLEASQHVIAVELDQYFSHALKEKFLSYQNLTVYNEDIMNFHLPSLPYKVFANIPFAIEGKIVRKLIDAPSPPEDCYLVIVRSLANRLSAKDQENMFSITHKPWFDFDIVYHFKPWDFTPFPNVEAVLWRFTKHKQPKLPLQEKDKYRKFVEIGFGHGLSINRNLLKIYGHQRANLLLSQIGVAKNTLPNQLSLEKWIKLFELVSLSRR